MMEDATEWTTRLLRDVILRSNAEHRPLPSTRLTLLAAMHGGILPDEAIDDLVALLDDPEVRCATNASDLVHAITINWDEVSPRGRVRIVAALERAYPVWTDWMACFTTTELLGTQVGGAAALDLMRRLRERSTGHALELIPHGFEHLASESPEPELARAALAELLAMRNHPSADVRCEVDISLGRLRRRVAEQPGHALSGAPALHEGSRPAPDDPTPP